MNRIQTWIDKVKKELMQLKPLVKGLPDYLFVCVNDDGAVRFFRQVPRGYIDGKWQVEEASDLSYTIKTGPAVFSVACCFLVSEIFGEAYESEKLDEDIKNIGKFNDEQLEALVDEFQSKLAERGIKDLCVLMSRETGSGYEHRTQMYDFVRGNYYAAFGMNVEFLQHRLFKAKDVK